MILVNTRDQRSTEGLDSELLQIRDQDDVLLNGLLCGDNQK